tara:strand:- start:8167 stop:8505 length:339 start_codon:yes stop_codon:yes gene_type:complete
VADVAWWWIAALGSFSGAVWLALAKPVHWAQVMSARAARGHPAPVLRCLGWLALAAALAACLRADAPTMAVLVWVMLLVPAALAVAMVLAWRPAILRCWGAAVCLRPGSSRR